MPEADSSATARVVTKAPPWHTSVAIDLLCSSLASGLFAVAAIIYLLGDDADRAVARVGFVLAFPVTLVDLVCLVIDLGDPLRFMNMTRVFKPGSPMSIGVWAIVVFSFVSFICFVISILPLPGTVLFIFAAVGLPFALVVGNYKGVLFSTTAQPGWSSMRWLGALLSISAGAMGVATLLAIAALAPADRTSAFLREALVWILVLYAIVFVVLEREGDQWTRGARRAFPAGMWLTLLVGIIVPLAIALLAAEPGTDCVAALCVIAGSVAFRDVLVKIPHRLGAN
jgi:formate-dependent nitrite reductase membrane component NrfD